MGLTYLRRRLGVSWAPPFAVVVAIVLAAGCGPSPSSPTASPTTGSPTTGSPSTGSPGDSERTTSPITVAAATTTVVPDAPRAGAEAAADALVSSWSAHNRPVALSVATPDAVAELFAVRYPDGGAVFRQCTDAFTPFICTYGPPGGGPSTDRIFQLYVSPTYRGWYVHSVVIEG